MQHSMLCSRISPICLVSHQAPFRYAFLKRFASFRFHTGSHSGLFIGCLISNLITGGIIWDIIFGSIATLLGALGTYFLRKKKFVYTLPPVIANIIIVPLVLRYGYGFTTIYKGVDISLLFNAVTVGIGEIISICVLGSLLKEYFRNTEM